MSLPSARRWERIATAAPHFHTLVAEGVFEEKPSGRQRFAGAPPPTDVEVARLLASVRRRIVGLVRRHGIDLAASSPGPSVG